MIEEEKFDRVQGCLKRSRDLWNQRHPTVSYTHLDVYKRQLSAGGLDSKPKTESAIKQFGALMNAVVPAIEPQLRELKMHTLLS